jgi:hypothetical protein
MSFISDDHELQRGATQVNHSVYLNSGENRNSIIFLPPDNGAPVESKAFTNAYEQDDFGDSMDF